MRRERTDAIAYTLRDAAEVVGMSETGKIIILRRDLEAFVENLPDDWWGFRI